MACALILQAEPSRNWPAWRGPLATGVAPHADPPVRWSESENVKWKVAIPGRGSSTPIIWENQVFILTAIPESGGVAVSGAAPEAGEGRGGPPRSERPSVPQQFTILSLDRATGTTQWKRVARTALPHEGHHRDHGYASASPVTDGEVLIASFGSHGIHAYDLKGNRLWEKDLGRMQTRNSFGEGSSPGLDGDRVFILWDHEGEDFIVALDRKTGRELWRKPRNEPTGWSTPVVVEHGGRRQVIVNGSNRVRSYAVEDGELLWEAGGQTVNTIPSIVAGDGLVFATSGFRGAALHAIRLGRTGDLTGTDAVAWTLAKSTPYVPSPLLYEGLLYYFASNNATLSVVEARSGKIHLDAERLEGMFGVYASPAGAAGRVYIVGRDGNARVIKAGSTLEVLARNKLDEGIDASPALVGRELFLRGQQHLFCIAAQ